MNNSITGEEIAKSYAGLSLLPTKNEKSTEVAIRVTMLDSVSIDLSFDLSDCSIPRFGYNMPKIPIVYDGVHLDRSLYTQQEAVLALPPPYILEPSRFVPDAPNTTIAAAAGYDNLYLCATSRGSTVRKYPHSECQNVQTVKYYLSYVDSKP